MVTGLISASSDANVDPELFAEEAGPDQKSLLPIRKANDIPKAHETPIAPTLPEDILEILHSPIPGKVTKKVFV